MAAAAPATKSGRDPSSQSLPAVFHVTLPATSISGVGADGATALHRLPVAACVTAAACTALLALIMTPYLGSLSGLNTRLRSEVRIAVVDLDTASPIRIGPVLQAYLAAAKAANGPASPPLPAFDAGTGITAVGGLVDQIEHGTVWGGFVVQPGAGAALAAALAAAPNATVPPYDPSAAIGFYYDEAWTQTLSPRATSPARTVLARFTPVFAQALAHTLATSGPGGPAAVGALAAYAPALLVAPVTYTEFNLHPAWQIPVSLHAITAAVLMAIVASLASANLSLRYLPHPASPGVRLATDGYLSLSDGLRGPPTPLGIVHARAVCMAIGSAFVGGTYAVIVVGMAGDGYTGGGTGWARLWAVMWLTSLCISWFMGGVLEASGLEYAAVVFIPVAYYNALGGWNVEPGMSPPGYVFFYYTPAWNAVNLVRNILFGTRADEVGTHVGVLFGWAAFGLIFYYVMALWARPTISRAMRAAGMFSPPPQPPAVETAAGAGDGLKAVEVDAGSPPAPLPPPTTTTTATPSEEPLAV